MFQRSPLTNKLLLLQPAFTFILRIIQILERVPVHNFNDYYFFYKQFVLDLDH